MKQPLRNYPTNRHIVFSWAKDCYFSQKFELFKNQLPGINSE
ncbi:hypothetical protein [Arundinibacter roseus]|nr:hypothetical protein [Arundinibacter roseus]